MAIPRLCAFVLAALISVLTGAGAVLAVVGDAGGARAGFAVGTALALPSVVLGLVIALRRPRIVVGPLLMLVGAMAVWDSVGDLYASVITPRSPFSELYLALSQGDWMLLYVPAALLMLVFPDGRPPGRRWRWVIAGLLVVPVLFMLIAASDPEPAWEAAGLALLPVFLGLLIASAAGMVLRYRRARGEVARARLKWFAFGAGGLPLTLLLCWASYLFLDGPELALAGLAATALTVPAATTIAMLRHDLYDVDRAISAAVTYGLVTAVLLGFYTAASFLAGLGSGQNSPVAAAAGTAVCAAALSPLRARLQRRVDRRFYPARQAVLMAVEELRDRMHAGQAQPEELEATLRAGLRDPALRVGYRLPGATGFVDVTGAPVDPGGALAIPVRLGGHDIGVIVGGGGATRELLRAAASAGALLIEVVRLRVEAGRALEEAEAGRTRLLHAGYEERRRLERDLHDGAQQRLVSLGMAIRLAQRHLQDGTVDVDGLLDQWVAELAVAVTELRRIAHGLRPSSLDDGLGNALVMLAGKVPIPVKLDVAADDLPDDVAMTAYYVVSEAVANAVKHAGPASIGVRVSRSDDQITILVSDDGPGGAEIRPGTGLAGLVDRVRAAGGTLRLHSPAAGGTLVEAVLPCAS